eukprot:gb/GECG01000616.1/.p1 GENE.gb/GECG01000616.1/~~gb/GECG01000616.1/.p1  ORF type:complete len:281 (+),score=27.06 gb/GECG01000616.1/:1-843(+)
MMPMDDDGGGGMMMSMYFHSSIKETVLFKGFQTHNAGTYFGALVFAVALGILKHFLAARRRRVSSAAHRARALMRKEARYDELYGVYNRFSSATTRGGWDPSDIAPTTGARYRPAVHTSSSSFHGNVNHGQEAKHQPVVVGHDHSNSLNEPLRGGKQQDEHENGSESSSVSGGVALQALSTQVLDDKTIAQIPYGLQWSAHTVYCAKILRCADALLHTIITAIAFLNMLIAMLYNVGLFIAVCVGEGLGLLIFSYESNPQESETELMKSQQQMETEASCH